MWQAHFRNDHIACFVLIKTICNANDDKEERYALGILKNRERKLRSWMSGTKWSLGFYPESCSPAQLFLYTLRMTENKGWNAAPVVPFSPFIPLASFPALEWVVIQWVFHVSTRINKLAQIKMHSTCQLILWSLFHSFQFSVFVYQGGREEKVLPVLMLPADLLTTRCFALP